MKHKKIDCGSYNIHFIKTDKFKQNIIKINFRNEINKKDILKRKMISNILLESNAKYKTSRLLNIKKEELYNLQISSGASISGNSYITSFTSVFLNDKYAPNLFEEVIKFMSEIILNPKIKNKEFDKDAFKNAYNLALENISLDKENPSLYSLEKIYKLMSPNTPLSYPRNGTIRELKNITSKDLYDCYKRMLNEDTIDIFVLGNIKNKDIELIKKHFIFEGKRKNQIHFIEHNDIKEKVLKVSEKKPYNQSNLILGYKLKGLTDFERNYVLPIYTYILGGGPDSNLFKNVREKNSLCYSISAVPRIVSNILFITSGINHKNYNKALKLIHEEVDKMANKEFTNEDIKKAKIVYQSAYEETMSSMYGIIGDYISHEYLNIPLISERKNEILKVTKEDIIKMIPKIHEDTVFFLEGSKENEEA